MQDTLNSLSGRRWRKAKEIGWGVGGEEGHLRLSQRERRRPLLFRASHPTGGVKAPEPGQIELCTLVTEEVDVLPTPPQTGETGKGWREAITAIGAYGVE